MGPSSLYAAMHSTRPCHLPRSCQSRFPACTLLLWITHSVAQGMDLEAAKLAVDSAKDTQLITLNKLLTPPELGTGSRSGSGSDSDAEAHLEPYAVEQDPAKPLNRTTGSSSQKQRLEREGLAAGGTPLQLASARPSSAEAHKPASQPAGGEPPSPETQQAASQAAANRSGLSVPLAQDVRAAEAVVRSTMLPVQVPLLLISDIITS